MRRYDFAYDMVCKNVTVLYVNDLKTSYSSE